jgi:hypothetical protein
LSLRPASLDRATALRKAFGETMTDQAYLAEMKAKKLDVGPISWRAIESLWRISMRPRKTW